MPMFINRNVFNAGELSPLLDGRTDLPNFGYGCRVMKNFLPRTHGGAFRRPGTEYLGTLSGSCRLMDFNVTATMQYVLELTDEKLRLWQDGEIVKDASNAVVELTTPYLEADLFEVQVKQINNFAYFAHPAYPVQRLTRSIDGGSGVPIWEWSAVDWTYPAMRGENTSATTVTAAATTGDGIVLEFTESGAPKDVFLDSNNLEDYIGTYVEITHLREKASETLALEENPEPEEPEESAVSKTATITIVGDYTITTYGTWWGTLAIEMKDASDEWREIRVFEGSEDEPRNISYKATAEKVAQYRLKFTHTGHRGNPTAVIEVENTRYSGLAQISGMISEGGEIQKHKCEANIITPIYAPEEATPPATPYFRLGAWGKATGYPRAVTFHEQRLVFGGTETQPNTVWMSGTNDFHNFRYGAYDSDPLSFTLAAEEASPIQSLLSHVALLIFTQSEEWALLTSEQTPITPANLFVRRQSRIGTAQKPALIAHDSILILERGGQKLRRFAYGGETGGVSEDLTVLAEHLTRTGIKQIAFQRSPDPIVWCVTYDGQLISMTFDHGQNVTGWSRHETEGVFESVAVTYGDDGVSDEVYCVVKRTFYDPEAPSYEDPQYHKTFLERFHHTLAPEYESVGDENIYLYERPNFIHLDCAIMIDLADHEDSAFYVPHLNHKTVTVVLDGIYVEEHEVVDGGINTYYSGTYIVIGLPYESMLQPSKFELETPGGTAQGRTFQTERVTLNVWRTKGIEVADYAEATEAEWHPVGFYDPALPEASSISLFTGLVDEQIDGAHRENIDVTVRQKQPFPAAILSIIPKFETHGN